MTKTKKSKDVVTIEQIVKDVTSVLKAMKWAKANSGRSLFKLLAGINRPITPGHVTKMDTSVGAMGIIRPVVTAVISFLDGKPTRYVLDAQHLLFDLFRRNCDIPYVTIEVKNKRDLIEKIALLNSSSKPWCTADYVTAWGSIENSYKLLAELYHTYDIELGQIAEIAHTGTIGAKQGHQGGSFYRLIKRGDFKILDIDDCRNKLDKVTDVLKLVPRSDRVHNNMFIASYVNLINALGTKYNHAKFLTYLKTHKQQFATVTQDPEEISKLLKKAVTGK